MCKSKGAIRVTETQPKNPRTRRTPSKSPSAGDPPSSFSSASGSGGGGGGGKDDPTSSSSQRDWSISSISTQAALSLSAIKQSIADTAHHIYDFPEICSATANFRGRRFSSSSWRCRLRDRDVLIFQRKFRRPLGLPELRRRLAALCKGHHLSLIPLLGASVSGDYVYLVYDHVPSASSLADCLRQPRNPSFTVLPTWLSRMRVAADVAHGLDYVHHSAGLDLRLVHNRISSSAILVTQADAPEENHQNYPSSLTAKICHFGAAALCGEIDDDDNGDEGAGGGGSGKLRRSGSRAMRIEGTKGYMAPELQAAGIPTQATDVYAFGVVILELLSGSEPVRYRVDEESGGYERESVIAAAREAAEGGRLRRWVDRRLRDSYPVEAAERMLRVGLECVDPDPGKRPDMGRVAHTVSKLYLESAEWAEKVGVPVDFSVSLAPR